MAQVTTDQNGVVINRVVHQSKLSFLPSTKLDFSDAHVESFHLERSESGIKIVSDGIVDRQAEINAQRKNAGLVNILKMQELRYGTIDNAIARNADKQVYADVSNIPTTVAEQAEYVREAQAAVEALCARLGISKEELLNSSNEQIASHLEAANNAGNQGGNE